MAPSLKVGAQPIALVQNGAIQELVFPTSGTNMSIPHVLPAPSTAGTCLVTITSTGNAGTDPLGNTMPDGWQLVWLLEETINRACLNVYVYPNNPGGILAVNQVIGSGASGALWMTHMSEWLGISPAPGSSTGPPNFQYLAADVLDDKSWDTEVAGTSMVPFSLPYTITLAGDLSIAAWVQQISSSTTATFTSPPGYTRLADNGSLSRFAHLDIEYQVNPPITSINPQLTSNRTTVSAAGAWFALKRGTPQQDMTRNIANESISAKLNTLDVELELGGYFLTEDGGRYLTEDGSGFYMLDDYVPQLGDPVALTEPTWNGRVVTVTQSDIHDMVTNHQHVTVAATNQDLPGATTPPGDLSDNPSGGRYLLEDGSGRYLMEDGSGYFLLESTTFGYRNLRITNATNQDGSSSVYGSCETEEGGFAAGQTFRLYSTNLGINGTEYAITNVITTWKGVAVPTYLIEFGDAYQTLQQAGGGILTRQGSEATRFYGVVMPGGVLGSASIIADFGTFTGVTDVDGLAVTVTVAAGRRIEISCQAPIASSVAGDRGAVFIRESSTNLVAMPFELADAAVGYGGVVAIPITPTAGTHTYKVSAARDSGTGNITVKASSTNPAWIIVKDIGA